MEANNESSFRPTISSNGEFIAFESRASNLVVADTNSQGLEVFVARNSLANQPPIAQEDNIATDEDATLSGDVLADNGNGADSDPDGDSLMVTQVNGNSTDVDSPITLASGALLTQNSDGTFSYDPNGQFESLAVGETASESYTYTVSDGIESDTATVTVTINGVNDTPAADDDARTTTEDADLDAADADGTATGDANDDGVLVNDADVDGDGLMVDEVEGAGANVGGAITLTSGAVLTVDADGTFIYAPNGAFESLDSGESSADSFSYRSADDNGGTDTATVAMSVNGVNDPPVARADQFSTDEDIATSGNVFTDNGNGADSDPDDPLSVMNTGTLTATGLGGTVELMANGDFSYDPPAEANGTDSFDYTLEDDNGATSTATVTITVNPVNDAPSFSATDPAAVNEEAGEQTVNGWASFDPGPANESGQSVMAYTVSNVGDPSLFSAGPAVDPGGNLTYTPAEDANGSSSFDVAVQDDGGTANSGDDTSAPQTFTIIVNPVNDAPTFTAGGDVETFEDTAVDQPWASNISPGPPDEAGQSVSFLVTDNTNPGLFSTGPALDPSGQLNFTPSPDTTGSAAITVEAEDDGGMANGGDPISDPATFTVDVIAAADLAIDKTSGSFFTPPGGMLTYELVVTNPGPSDIVDARVEDPEPARLTFGNWQCAPAGLAVCNTAMGSGPVDVLVTIPEGDSVTVTVDAQLIDTDTVPVTNTATVTAPNDVTELNASDNSDSDTDAVGMFVDSFETVEPD